MAEPSSYSFNKFSTTEGEVRLGDVMENNAKMAVMIRRIFPSSFKRSQYIGMPMTGKMDGAIINSAPSTYQILCGEKPVDGVAFVAYAENGDMILGAPQGRIRIFAQDIDLIASGNGTNTGWINIRSNATIQTDAPNINLEAADALGFACERDLNLNVPGRFKVSAGSIKFVEGPDVSPVTSPFGSGANSILQQLEGLLKLIKSIA
jgi:hypothetical protein